MAVLEVHDADDVVAAVRWAVDHGFEVTAQPTGHAGLTTLDQTLLLRTRALGGIEVDVQRRTATIGAGVKAGELLAALEGTGLTFLAGSNPDVSVTGMTITGGISWFGRAYGLGADSIVSVELVDGLGRCRRLSATEDPELFWAVRGGGGDFGIITRLEVALHPAPAVYGGRFMWPLEQMGEVLRTFRRATQVAPEELTTWFHVYSFPPLPELPEPIRGKAFAAVAVAFIGSRDEAEPHLAAYRAIPGMAMDLVGEVPLSALGSIADEPTDPTPGMQRSHLLEDLDDAGRRGAGRDRGAGQRLAAHGRADPTPRRRVRRRPCRPRVARPGHRALQPVRPRHPGRARAGRPDRAVLRPGRRRRRPRRERQDPGELPGVRRGPRPLVDPRHARPPLAAKQVSDPLGTIRSNRPVRP